MTYASYENTNTNNVVQNPLQEEPTHCPTIVREDVCVQGTVTITPNIEVGESVSFCRGNPIIGSCPGTLMRNCTFTVSQNICVQIPLAFSATAAATPNGLVCGTPQTGECVGEDACTRTIGFFRNHPDVTNALITAAGGSITLGDGSAGASFTVTTANANAVLNLNTPSPPAPGSPPFANQYQELYAQLLAAKLNALSIIALGADVCPFAVAAIAAADAFLAASPPGVGMAGAPDVQEPLAQFNEGNAPGCPIHCSD